MHSDSILFFFFFLFTKEHLGYHLAANKEPQIVLKHANPKGQREELK
jgi:hypothetical protein